MARPKGSRKPPSRKRYEEEHPTISCRLDRDTYMCLKGYLESTGCSFADFVKDALGREGSMIEKRVEIMASRQVDPSKFEDRLRCVEDLVFQRLCVAMDRFENPPLCPRCDNQELFECEGRETESTLASPWVITWKCPKCGYFLNTYKGIDPGSITWIDPKSGDYIDKPKALAKHWPKKH